MIDIVQPMLGQAGSLATRRQERAQRPEELLAPGEPIFEYWGHEASWLPIELYPVFAFRRREYQAHPWWGDLIGDHPEVARGILCNILVCLAVWLCMSARSVVDKIPASASSAGPTTTAPAPSPSRMANRSPRSLTSELPRRLAND